MLRSLCPMCKRFLPSIQHSVSYSSPSTLNDEIPVIDYPLQRQKEFVRKQKEKRKKGKVIIVPRPGKLLISANERRLNMYTNEFPTKFEPPTLASETWTSHKSPGRHFTIHPHKENPSLDLTKTETTSFEELQLSESILDAVKGLGLMSPTNIQAKAIPEILRGDNIMISAETGSGKTLSYLLPIMHKLLEMKRNSELSNDSVSALVLTPSKELCYQVMKMASSMKLPLNIGNLDDLWLKRLKKKVSSMDVLISTPILALTALRRRFLTFDQLQSVVIDECDTLLDESFSEYVCNILGRMNIRSGVSQPLQNETRTQLILCSATFPEYAERALKDVISIADISAVSTGYMHRVPPHVTQKFLRVKPSEKLSTVTQLLQESDGPTLVFCNKKTTVHWLTNELISLGLNVKRIHSRMDFMERISTLDTIQSGQSNILVATDLSSRGLDTQRIRHIINYDFPTQASDYIHRSGRVGRVGQEGGVTVTSLICKKWEVPLVMKIEEAARRRERIEGVNANIKSYHAKRWEKLLESYENGLSEYN